MENKTYQIGENTYDVYRINADVNGNPRYVVHFLDLGIKSADYGKIPGLNKYRAKWFGGGYVFSSYYVPEDLVFMMKRVKEYYKNKGEKN